MFLLECEVREPGQPFLWSNILTLQRGAVQLFVMNLNIHIETNVVYPHMRIVKSWRTKKNCTGEKNDNQLE